MHDPANKRINLILTGYTFAAVSAGLAMPGAALILNAPHRLEPLSMDGLWPIGVLTIFSVVFTLLYPSPFAAVILFVAEKWRIRSVFYYVILATLTGFLMMLGITLGYREQHTNNYIVTSFGGALAGFVYWFIAGRKAGA